MWATQKVSMNIFICPLDLVIFSKNSSSVDVSLKKRRVEKNVRERMQVYYQFINTYLKFEERRGFRVEMKI